MIKKILCLFGKHKYEMQLITEYITDGCIIGIRKTVRYVDVCKHCGIVKNVK